MIKKIFITFFFTLLIQLVFCKVNGNYPTMFYVCNVQEINDSTILITTDSEILLIDKDGLVLNRKRFSRIFQVLLLNSDSIQVLYYKSDTVLMKHYLVSEIISNRLEHVSSDSIVMPTKQFAYCTAAVYKNETYFCYSSCDDPYNVDIFLGYTNAHGYFSDSMTNFKYDYFWPYKMLVSRSKDVFLFFPLAQVMQFDSSFNLEHNLSFAEKDFTDDYDAFWDTDRTNIVGGTSFYGQLMVIKSGYYLNEQNKIEFAFDGETCKAGINSNLAKGDDGFYFLGTKGYSLDYPDGGSLSSIFVAKIDYDFNIIWERTFGGDAYYKAQSITSLKSGGCMVAASKYNWESESSSEELALFRLDIDGEINQLILGVDQKETFINNIYPNPGKGQFQITLTHNTKGYFNLFDINGKRLLRQSFDGSIISFDAGKLPSGIYVYEVLDDFGNSSRGKWIKN